MAIKKTGNATVITGGHIQVFRLMSLRAQVKLEAAGLKGRANATAYAKRTFGVKGNRDKVIARLDELIAEQKLKADTADFRAELQVTGGNN
jgi:hypothetical protein